MMALFGNWKVLAGVAGMVGLFFAGWTTNGWRWEAKIADAEASHTIAVRAARKEVFDQWKEQTSIDEQMMAGITLDVDRLRVVNSTLQTELTNAQLVKPLTVVETRWREQVISEEIETCGPPVLANPFSSEFARLFNQSSRRDVGGLPGADSED